MNYLAQVFSVKHDWWRYLVGLNIILFFWQFLGAIPLMTVIYNKLGIQMAGLDQSEMLSVLESNTSLFLVMLMFVFGLLGVFVAVKSIHKQSILSLTTARSKVDWSRVFFAFSVWGVISILFVLVGYFLVPEEFIWNFKWDKFLILFIISVFMIPLQTSFEEYLFRGYLMQGIAGMTNSKIIPLLMTSIVFGLLHFANPEVEKLGPITMFFYIGTGLLLGVMTLMDDGLELALGFHAANNLFTALLVSADWTALKTESILIDISEPTAGFDIFLPVIVLYPIVLFVFAKKYNWSDWKGKLIAKVE